MGAGDDGARRMRIAIIGAGPGGLCMAKRLTDAGFDDFVLLEKSDAVGGTWNHNRYPGCACDVPSNLYSFSFAVKRDWSRPYAPQPEILAYMQQVAERFGVLPHCRFGVEVTRAVWHDADAAWALTLGTGETLHADVVVSAIGMFNDLTWPDIPGVHDFGGTTFHSAQWDWSHDLTGERVAVVGSAASAVQFVPEIAPEVGRLHLFQRTANWVLPKLDDPYTPEQIEAFLADPSIIDLARDELHRSMDQGMTFSDMAANAEREKLGLALIDTVEDPVTREKLRPDHPWGCKRPLFSNNWYPTFNRPNVELVTDRIERIAADAVITADGTRREVDTLILATGFSATKYLSAIDVVGRNGRRIDDAWNDGAQAYLGITTSGFPNLFMLYGPNTNNGSILTMIEYQVEHVLAQVQRLVDERLAWVDVRPEPQARFNEEVQRAIAGVTVWQGGCNGYYRAPSGRVVTQWPFSMTEFRERTATVDPDAFEVAPAR
jgi:cation diffusion facilitator CzcD-associated flavoprotein CzcO